MYSSRKKTRCESSFHHSARNNHVTGVGWIVTISYAYFQTMNYNRPGVWNVLLLLIRIWLAYAMIKNGNCVLDIISSQEERLFFKKWFGEELHFPFPVFMAFLAKGSELIGGILLVPGLFTKVSASFIAFTMLVATLTANLGEDFNIDGGFTISYFLFALVFIVWGGGKYSVDYLLFKKQQPKTGSISAG